MTEYPVSGVEMNKRRTHTNEFKARVALEAVRGDKTINEIASDYKIHPNMIAKWKKQLMERIPDVFEHGMKEKPDDAEKEELYKQIGKMKVELDWLKKKSDLSVEDKRMLIEPEHENGISNNLLGRQAKRR